jgi:hypothetical protein
MIPIASALATVLQVAGVIGDLTPYVDVIMRINQKGESISQAELDNMLAEINQRSQQIQGVEVPKADA